MKEAKAADSSLPAQLPDTPISSPGPWDGGPLQLWGCCTVDLDQGFLHPYFPPLNTDVHVSPDMKTRVRVFDGFLRVFLARTLEKRHTHVHTSTPT